MMTYIDCYGDLTDDQVVQEVQGVPIAHVDDEEVKEEVVEVPSNADTLQALSTIRHFLDSRGLVHYPIEEKVCRFYHGRYQIDNSGVSKFMSICTQSTQQITLIIS